MILDTHVLVWLIEGDDRLGDEARRLVEVARAADSVFVPVISAWEIALFTRSGRIALSLDAPAWINLVLAMPGFMLAPLEPSIAVAAARLAWPHRDPADRFIVATALDRGMPLLTADERILAYAADGHVKAIDARR